MNQPQLTDQQTETPQDWGERLRYYYYLGKVLFRRHWWILVITTALGTGWKGWEAFESNPTYTSYAKIMLSGFVANTVSSNNLSGGIQEQFGYWFGNQKQILENREVKQAALERVRAFHPDIGIRSVTTDSVQIPDTAVIQISAKSDAREFTRIYLNALIEEYLNFRQQMKGETAERALLSITERIDSLEEQIKEQEEAVVEFRKEHNLVYIQEQGDAAGSNLARLKSRQGELQTQKRLLETVGQNLDLARMDLLGLENELLGPEARQNMREAQQQLDQTRAQLEEFSMYLKPKHPKVISLKDDVERMSNMLSIYRKQALEEVKKRREQLEVQLENLDIIIQEQESVALDNSRLSAEFERLQANLSRSRNLYENLLGSIQNLETGQQIDSQLVKLLEGASPPIESKLSMQKQITEGVFLGFFVGVGLLAGIGFIDTRIISADDLKRRHEQPVMGIIPVVNRDKDGRIGILQAKDPRHLFAEACRSLRSSVFFMGTKSDRPQLIVVTSSVPAEGKSTVALNLAAAVSFTSARTLLVDGDLRRGHIADSLGLNREPGLSDVLQKGQSLESTIQESGVENLFFLPSGKFPERPGELLLSRRMDEVMTELRKSYDYIIFDTAPILATDDTTGFSVKADTVLFVVRSTITHTRQLKTALDRLEMRGASIGGFVLNCVDVKGTDYYYYKKYHDYYAYSPR